MTFQAGILNLVSGRAIKRPSMVGYIERVMLTPAENVSNFPTYDAASTYAQNAIVNVFGTLYKAQGAISANKNPPDNIGTGANKWDVYNPLPEEYKLVFHNRAGNSYEFYYNTRTGTSRTDSTNLLLKKELLTHFLANDWIEGLASDYAQAADSSSTSEW